MKERGKALEAYNHNNNNKNDMEYYSTTSDMPCKRHPSSSSVGICAYCLKDRLVKLVCSDCGEQRLSSCSCSEISSNRNSCTVEVGSVGRVSFLIENERSDVSFPSKNNLGNKTQMGKTEEEGQGLVLRRSSSSCAEIKRSGFWRFGKFFKKKKEKDCANKSVSGFDVKSDIWLVDHDHDHHHQMGVSRSRSLCSFRGGGGGGGGWFGSEDGGDLMVSGARSSISGARSSSVTACMVLDSGRRSGFSEAEPRKSGFDSESGLVSEFGMRRIGLVEVDNSSSSNNNIGGGFNGVNRRVFSLKESDFNGMDDSGFIDLKLDYSAESKSTNNNDHHYFSSSMKMGGITSDSESAFGSMRRGSEYGVNEYGDPFGSSVTMGDGIFNRGGSCRITVNDRGLKKGRKSLKGWRWIFRHHPSWGNSGKKDENLMFKT